MPARPTPPWRPKARPRSGWISSTSPLFRPTDGNEKPCARSGSFEVSRQQPRLGLHHLHHALIDIRQDGLHEGVADLLILVRAVLRALRRQRALVDEILERRRIAAVAQS